VSRKDESPAEKLKKKVESAANKKIKARKEGSNIIFGMGLFGIVGWSIAMPTLIGIALGIYVDKRFPMGVSWTLTLLFAGVIVGSFNAWYWVKKHSEDDGGGV
jgi:ATP synthase protein I